MARTTSRPCNLKSCGNTVNLKNYPNGYCWLHQSIPGRILKIKDMPLSEYNDLVRNVRPSGSTSFVAGMVRDLSTGDRFPLGTAKMLVNDYFSKGNLSIPSVADRITDRDLEETVAKMNRSKEWKSAELAVVRDGKTAGVNGVLSSAKDRLVIYGDSSDTSSYGRFIIDPRIATASHVDNYNRSVDNEYQSGVTPFGDGIYVDRVYRYCQSSSMSFDRIESTDGDLLYKNEPDSAFESREFEENARRLIREHGPMPTAPIVYDRKTPDTAGKPRIVDRFTAMNAASKSYTSESEYYEEEAPIRKDR